MWVLAHPYHCASWYHVTEFAFSCPQSCHTDGQCVPDVGGSFPSAAACAATCGAPAPSHTGTGGGGGGGGTGTTVLLVFCLGLVLPYFAGGMAYRRYRGGETGTGMIPHRQFWQSLPGLILTGFRFTASKLTGGGGGSYEAL